MFYRRPSVTFGMRGMRMMRTWQVWERRPVVAMRRRMKRTLRARFVRVMMYAGHKAVVGCVVVILAFVMCQVVLRFLCDRAHPADDSLFV
jgi:hypothetical protein